MNNLFGEELPLPLKNGKAGKPKENPLIRVFGAGPEGKKCKDCQYQYFREFASKYSKCEVRGGGSSPKTDHNSRYAACGKFQPKPSGQIFVRFRCNECGTISTGHLENQVHHNARMLGFGWESTGEFSPEGWPIWIHPQVHCSKRDCYVAYDRKQRKLYR